MTDRAHTPLWTKSFSAAFSTNMFTALCFYVLLAAMPLFITRELKLDESHIGLVMGAFSITGVIARPVAGAMVDSIGRMALFIFALVFFLLCVIGYTFVATFFFLVVMRLLHGVGWGMVSTIGSTIAADLVPASRRAEGLGYYAMTMSIGMALGPAAGVYMLDHLSFQQVFLVCSILSLLALIMGSTVRVPKIEKKKIHFSFGGFFEKRVLGLAFMLGFYGIVYGSIMGFIVVYGEKLGVANGGVFFMVFALVLTFTRPIIGRMLDRGGPGHTMTVGFALVMVTMLLLGFARGPLLYMIAAPVLGLGAGIVMPLLTAMAINIVPPNRRGAANATIFTAFDSGIGIGGIALGYIAGHSSISTMYFVATFILIIPMAFYYLREKSYYERMRAQIS
jgi:MFS family permease